MFSSTNNGDHLLRNTIAVSSCSNNKNNGNTASASANSSPISCATTFGPSAKRFSLIDRGKSWVNTFLLQNKVYF